MGPFPSSWGPVHKADMQKFGRILADRKRKSYFSGILLKHFAIGIIWESRESIEAAQNRANSTFEEDKF